ncbi:hypothetical protein [Halobaculum marinum]|uniref:MFS transporter n=1 Tax=Halobaculum marinum TaxID=3031996 RepID=A0ABD5X0K8_9EURY|nr:hypothetical protein [Halobaculum sp. DT55]
MTDDAGDFVPAGDTGSMDRQQVLALVLVGLMMFSSLAYAVSFL